MNKRAITEVGILTIIFGILVVMAILTTMPVLYRVLFGAAGEYRTAQVNLESLHIAVLQVLAAEGKFAAIRNFPLFIQENGFIIVAFNAEDDYIKSECYDERATRPVACLPDQACLCLYTDTAVQDFDDDMGENPPKQCTLLPKNVVFVAPWDGDDKPEKSLDGLGITTPTGRSDSEKGWNMGVSKGAPSIKREAHENLLLYGQCSDTIWNEQQTYIEKFQRDDGMLQIFIARESNYTRGRHKTFSKQFPPPTK